MANYKSFLFGVLFGISVSGLYSFYNKAQTVFIHVKTDSTESKDDAILPDGFSGVDIKNATNNDVKFYCLDKSGKVVGEWDQASGERELIFHNTKCVKLVGYSQ